MQGRWYVYLLRCADGSHYTGVTTNLGRRLGEHNHGPKGARYTRSRRPVTLAYYEAADDRGAAQQREYALRRLPAAKKRSLALEDRRLAPEKYRPYNGDS